MAATESGPIAPPASGRSVSLVRLYALRALFLVIALFLITGVTPNLASPPQTLMAGVGRATLSALGLLALLGVRYPLRMLPLMLFELGWKSVWLLAYGLPMWRSGTLDPAHAQTFTECAIGLPLVLIVLPWRYLWDNYAVRPGDRWR